MNDVRWTQSGTTWWFIDLARGNIFDVPASMASNCIMVILQLLNGMSRIVIGDYMLVLLQNSWSKFLRNSSKMMERRVINYMY